MNNNIKEKTLKSYPYNYYPTYPFDKDDGPDKPPRPPRGKEEEDGGELLEINAILLNFEHGKIDVKKIEYGYDKFENDTIYYYAKKENTEMKELLQPGGDTVFNLYRYKVPNNTTFAKYIINADKVGLKTLYTKSLKIMQNIVFPIIVKTKENKVMTYFYKIKGNEKVKGKGKGTLLDELNERLKLISIIFDYDTQKKDFYDNSMREIIKFIGNTFGTRFWYQIYLTILNSLELKKVQTAALKFQNYLRDEYIPHTIINDSDYNFLKLELQKKIEIDNVDFWYKEDEYFLNRLLKSIIDIKNIINIETIPTLKHNVYFYCEEMVLLLNIDYPEETDYGELEVNEKNKEIIEVIEKIETKPNLPAEDVTDKLVNNKKMVTKLTDLMTKQSDEPILYTDEPILSTDTAISIADKVKRITESESESVYGVEYLPVTGALKKINIIIDKLYIKRKNIALEKKSTKKKERLQELVEEFKDIEKEIVTYLLYQKKLVDAINYKKKRNKVEEEIFEKLINEVEDLLNIQIYINVNPVQDKPIKKITTKAAEGFERRYDYPPYIRDFIQRFGGNRITRLIVCRRPIWRIIQTFLNLVSMGKLNANMKKQNYDYLFHLFIIVKFDNIDQLYFIEKNQVVNIGKYKQDKSDQLVDINLQIPIQLTEFMSKPVQGYGQRIFEYNPVSANCQIFVLDMLNANGIDTKNVYEFVYQDVSKVLDGYPYQLSTIATIFANRFDTLVHGKGMMN